MLGLAVLRNLLRRKKELIYVVENKDWSIKHDGRMILNNTRLEGAMTVFPILASARFIHYGSINTFLSKSLRVKRGIADKHILTWFHIEPSDARVTFLKNNIGLVDLIHTSTSVTKCKLVAAGIPQNLIQVIPLGVDLHRFRPVSNEKKLGIRSKLKIPEDAFVIGSFQKDGEGWGEGRRPKMVKGPDIFCDTVERLYRQHPRIFVLLTGPSRGYVKSRLAECGVPFRHVNLPKQEGVVECYQAIDLYLITSREEGGPKAVPEAMACGVPLVTTSVGMVPDICVDGVNALVDPSATPEALANLVERVMSDAALAVSLASEGIISASALDWRNISKRYEEELYV